MGLDTGQSTTHIIPVILGSVGKTVKTDEALFEKGFYVCAIRPPTVPKDAARLRVSVQCGHTKEQLDGLCSAIGDVLEAG
jgi:8-amino-7-oxononanoate synthase